MRLPLRTAWVQGSPCDCLAVVSGTSPPEYTSSADRGPAISEATTVAGVLAFQGRVLRVHFEWDAPPCCGAATVVGQTLPIGALPDGAP